MKMLKKFLKTDYGKLTGSILIILAILSSYFRFVGPIPFSVSQTTTEKKTTFDVESEGKVTVIPDTAQITVSVTLSYETL